MHSTETSAILSVQPMLRRIVNTFAFQYHLDAEELFGEMQVSCIEAVRKHKEGKRTLVSWVHYVVTRDFLRRAKHPGFRARFALKTKPPEDTRGSRKSFSLRQLMFEVTEDAATAIRIAVEEGVPDRHYIEALLFVSYGWTETQINRVFKEVQEALK